MTAPEVVVLDYGSGNLRSAQRALECAGARVTVTADARAAATAAGLVVPGVGAFAACMRGLVAVGGDDVVRARSAAGRPTLGVCVGMQVLFSRGVEHGESSEGVGLFPGEVTRLHAPVVPHMGWTDVATPPRTLLFSGVERERFYFVHSYAARQAPGAVTYAEHGERFVAAVEHDGVVATQFHPEKSGPAGLALLRNWVGSLS